MNDNIKQYDLMVKEDEKLLKKELEELKEEIDIINKCFKYKI